MSTIDRKPPPPASTSRSRLRPRAAPPPSSSGKAAGRHLACEPGRQCEKFGLAEAMLVRDRYASVLEIGCGRGELAALLVDRCARYTGMDIDVAALAVARRRVTGDASVRFVPLSLPIALPPGKHELVVFTEVLQLFEPAAVHDAARVLVAHAPCREILIVGTRDEKGGARDAMLEAFVGACGDEFTHEELAVRRRYRIDALLR